MYIVKSFMHKILKEYKSANNGKYNHLAIGLSTTCKLLRTQMLNLSGL